MCLDRDYGPPTNCAPRKVGLQRPRHPDALEPYTAFEQLSPLKPTDRTLEWQIGFQDCRIKRIGPVTPNHGAVRHSRTALARKPRSTANQTRVAGLKKCVALAICSCYVH